MYSWMSMYVCIHVYTYRFVYKEQVLLSDASFCVAKLVGKRRCQKVFDVSPLERVAKQCLKILKVFGVA